MVFGSLSPENRINDRLRDLGASAIFLAILANIPASRFNLGLKNIKRFSQTDAELLLDLTRRLVEIRDAFRPLCLAMTDPEATRLLLDEMKTKNISADDIRQTVTSLFEQKP